MYKEEYGKEAYPLFIQSAHGNEWVTGMALLDYFAAQAAPQLIIKYNIAPDGCAKRAYEYAAAMMEERKKYLTPQTV